MRNIYQEFKQLSQESNLNKENLFELLLILILWRYLSDIQLTDYESRHSWTDPGSEYHFESLGNQDNSKSIAFFNMSLHRWRKANKSLDHIFNIDKRNLNADTTIKAWRLIKDITSDFLLKDRWSKEHSKTLLDKVSSLFLNDWQLAHEYFTPLDVSKLMIGLVKRTDAVTVYDPSCGSGDLLHAALIDLPKASRVVGAIQSSFMQKFAQIRSLLLDIPFDLFYHYEEVRDEKFDVILTNPPFGVKEPVYKNVAKTGKWSKSVATNRSERRYLTGILDRLSEKGTAVIILPNGILSEKASSFLKKGIVEENLVDAVIHLPKSIFYRTRVSASILLLNKQKKHTNTLFIDASKFGIKDGDRVHLADHCVRSILDLYYNNQQNTNSSTNSNKKVIHVGLDLLRKHDYDLQYTTYDTPVQYVKPRPSAEILKECLILETELTHIQDKIKKIIISI
jgi:type I restriction-modification system DNA methylase subunit